MTLWTILLALAALAPRPPHTHTIEIRGMAYQPATLTVSRGDTVIWINRDIVPHSATAASRPGLRWDTGHLAKDVSGRYVARAVGTVKYTCTLHPMMQGELRVE